MRKEDRGCAGTGAAKTKLPRVLITGGAGFIGSELVRQAVGCGYAPAVVDKLTYAGDLQRLQEVKKRFRFYRADISCRVRLEQVFRKERPEIIFHLAAESHVDRSINDATFFVGTNVCGTQILLDLARKYGVRKFIHVSTDEVYGEIGKGRFSESSPLKPNSPYSASKASADLFVLAYFRTYGVPVILARPSNNYGPWQYPEKFIPVVISRALEGKKVPVYARGLNRREWLHVSDCARAILLVMEKGRIGETYNIGSGHEERNIDLAKMILSMLGKSASCIDFVKDRPGHDFRYALDSSRIRRMGWKPLISFTGGLQETVRWYVRNQGWLGEKLQKPARKELC